METQDLLNGLEAYVYSKKISCHENRTHILCSQKDGNTSNTLFSSTHN